MSANRIRSITFRLNENFNPANCSFLYLNTKIHTNDAINGAKSLMSKTNLLTPMDAWKSLSIMDKAIVITKKTKTIIAH